MIVLSLFDGMSCGRVALERAGIHVTKYYASEIDKYAIFISEKNYKDIEQLGNVEYFDLWKDKIERPDLIIGGSPCQGFSFAGKQLAFDDPRSALFWKFVEIVKYYKPKYFLLENVRMKKEHLQVITDALGVEPICINSALVSAQNRIRYYWTNIPNVTQPEDKGTVLKDVIEHGVCDRDKSYCIDANYWKGGDINQYLNKKRRQIIFKLNNPDRYKLTPPLLYEHLLYRKLTPVECERLQTLPDNYTEVLESQEFLWYNKKEIDNLFKGDKWLENVVIQSVQGIHRPINTVICALDAIKDLKDMVHLKKELNHIKNVNFAIEKLSPEVGVIDTIKIGRDIKIQDILIRLENILAQEDTGNELTVETDTASLWRITWDGDYIDMKKYIILIWIKLIIGLKICTYVKVKANIQLSIDNLRVSQDNYLEMVLSNFKMVNIISKISNTQRYKMLGNGWTVDILTHIFTNLNK